MSKALHNAMERESGKLERLVKHADEVRQFIGLIALLKATGDDVDGEPWQHIPGDSDEAIDSLIEDARALYKKLVG